MLPILAVIFAIVSVTGLCIATLANTIQSIKYEKELKDLRSQNDALNSYLASQLAFNEATNVTVKQIQEFNGYVYVFMTAINEMLQQEAAATKPPSNENIN